jgi:mannose-6-phosphate isomerase-like protein (cupin superfamily)
MSCIAPEDAVVFNLPGIAFAGLAAPSRGARETSAWRLRIEPGTPATPHRLTREEILVATAGRARASIAGTEHDLVAGGAVIVPAETEFALSNPHAEPFEAVAILPVGGQARIGDEAPFTPPWAS